MKKSLKELVEMVVNKKRSRSNSTHSISSTTSYQDDQDEKMAVLNSGSDGEDLASKQKDKNNTNSADNNNLGFELVDAKEAENTVVPQKNQQPARGWFSW